MRKVCSNHRVDEVSFVRDQGTNLANCPILQGQVHLRAHACFHSFMKGDDDPAMTNDTVQHAALDLNVQVVQRESHRNRKDRGRM